MKLYKYDNGKGIAAINVAAITSVCPGYDNLEEKHCIYYTMSGYANMSCIIFDNKESRDDQLKYITKMMEEA